MRVLFVTDLPWVRTLGAVRMQVELSEALSEIGVEVEHLADQEIGLRRSGSRVVRVLHNPHSSSFAVKATRREAARFDVVDGHQALLPVSAGDLGMRGALVIRSAGTPMTYAAFEREERRVGRREANPVTRPLHALRRRRAMSLAVRSYRTADLAIVLNRDEEEVVRRLRADRAIARIPVGVPRDHLAALGRAAHGSDARGAAKIVAFVASWHPRKGMADWARIISHVWSRDPDVRFRFLGTSVDDSTLAHSLDTEVDGRRIQHHRHFSPDELPDHLADASVLALTSYVEGFPIVSLEAAAAGIPTVGYDTVGTREFPSRIPGGNWLVPAGDTVAMAHALVAAVGLATPARDAIAIACQTMAQEYSWDRLARRTLAEYERVLG